MDSQLKSDSLKEHRRLRQLASMTFYMLLAVSSLLLAYFLRYDFDLSIALAQSTIGLVLAVTLPTKLLMFWYFGLGVGSGWWRYASLADAVSIVQASLSALFLSVFILLMIVQFEGIPRSVLLLDAIVTIVLLSGFGFSTRLLRESYLPFATVGSSSGLRTLIVGAGEAGQAIVRETRKSAAMNIQIIGYADDDPLKQGRNFQGVPVQGGIESIPELAANNEIEQIIIAIPGAGGREMRRIVDYCTPAGVPVNTLPAYSDLIEGRVSVEQVRQVDVNDLLGRGSVTLDVKELASYLGGKRVLVTGAAGSIGSELCRQICRHGPRELVVLDVAESPLFFLDRELRESFELLIQPVIASVRDAAAVKAVFQQYSPDIVFHAAAYKHVPLMEQHPQEAVSVNVLGTKIVADMANEFSAESFVMVSTDKAVNPTNIMGATKRCAETYVQQLDRNSKTSFVTVRFGNVLNSAGSVIPIFRQQISEGGPVTVTDPEITRFFMTIPEASQLVLQAASMGDGGEIFLLDMGEPVKIQYLAEEMIRLSGFTPHEDIEIVYTGLRPGEKLYEELLLAGEGVLRTPHDSIRIAKASNLKIVDFHQQLDALITMPVGRTRLEYVNKLVHLVPEYSSSDPIMNRFSAG